jgi:hypothetical protein
VCLAALVDRVDGVLRRCLGVFEFSDDPPCILRLSIGRCSRDVTLVDGTHLRRGERIGELHLWNERVPAVPREGPDLAWAWQFQRGLQRSFCALAAYVCQEPSLADVRAFRGVNSFGSKYASVHMAGIAERWGLELVVVRPRGLWGHLRHLVESAYAVALIWAYNPNGLRGLDLVRLRRDELWISRRALMDRYRSAGGDRR